VHVKPNDAAAALLLKFAVRAVPAIFLLWSLALGISLWSGVRRPAGIVTRPWSCGSFTEGLTWLMDKIFLPKGDIFLLRAGLPRPCVLTAIRLYLLS
jgi:hypothetical protein